MTFPLSSRSTQIAVQNRFPIIEFEPLLDAIEAAALLRMHPNTLKRKARLGEILGRHVGKYWRFRVSDLNDWLWRQETIQPCVLFCASAQWSGPRPSKGPSSVVQSRLCQPHSKVFICEP